MEDYKKKYEEAISRMNKWVEGSEITDPKEVAEFVFPELKESEDERVREEIKIVLANTDLSQFALDHTFADMLAWLEKPKYTEEDLDKAYKCADEVQYRHGYEDAKKEIEKQGEKIDAIENFDTEFEKQVSYLIASTINKEHEYNEGFVKWAANALLNYAKHELEEQVEQKPSEDNCKISDCVEKVDMTEYNNGYECGKQRVLKYPEDYGLCKKPAWSEEDEGTLNSILNDLSQNVIPDEEDIQWLKSLKERYIWKPSDEQIEALLKLEEMHVLEHEKNQENAHLYMVVKSIREQLLKLKGE